MLSHKKGRYAGCYLPLTQANISMAQTLFLNRNEINNIQSSYLMLWGRNQKINYITPTDLLNEIDKCYEVLLKKYFSKRIYIIIIIIIYL